MTDMIINIITPIILGVIVWHFFKKAIQIENQEQK